MKSILKDIIPKDNREVRVVIDESFAQTDSVGDAFWLALIHVVEIQAISATISEITRDLSVMVAAQNDSYVLAAHFLQRFDRVIDDKFSVDT